MGFLYLFTVGLCGIGWLYDCSKYLSAAIRETRYRAYVSMNPVNYPEQYGLEWRKRVQKVLFWVVVGFFALIALGDLAGGKIFAAIPALATIAVVIPVENWQARIGGVIYGRRKTGIAILLAVVSLAFLPGAAAPAEDREPTKLALEESQVSDSEMSQVVKADVTKSAPDSKEESAEEEKQTPAVKPATDVSSEPEEKPSVEESSASVEEVNKNAGLVILSYPSTVSRNEIVTLEAQGKPNTIYTIEVYYKELSNANGLGSKTSDSNGYVSWTWKIGGHPSFGTFSIVVYGGDESITLYSIVQ